MPHGPSPSMLARSDLSEDVIITKNYLFIVPGRFTCVSSLGPFGVNIVALANRYRLSITLCDSQRFIIATFINLDRYGKLLHNTDCSVCVHDPCGSHILFRAGPVDARGSNGLH